MLNIIEFAVFEQSEPNVAPPVNVYAAPYPTSRKVPKQIPILYSCGQLLRHSTAKIAATLLGIPRTLKQAGTYLAFHLVPHR